MEAVEVGQNQPVIGTKRIKLEEIKAKEEEGGEDRISALPDSLLVEIVSRLDSTKEAIRTGTLSSRWKHIWTCLPVLKVTDLDLPSCSPIDGNILLSDFVSLVNKTLAQCRQLKLKKFELYTGYGDPSEIDNWIRYAIMCNVEELSLELWDADHGEYFELDHLFFISSCFTDLKVEGCLWNPSGAISWKNLTSLWITKGEFGEGLIKNILSGSPLLETLVLDDCYGFSRLDITSKSLKKLVLSAYREPEPCDSDTTWPDYFIYQSHDDVVEIIAPDILSLTIKGGLALKNLLLQNVSSLVEADLDYFDLLDWEIAHSEELLKRLILNLSHVKELRIGSCCSKVLSRLKAKGFVLPSNIFSLIRD